jgi:hypothetical protein
MTRLAPMLIPPVLAALTIAALAFSVSVQSGPTSTPNGRESPFYCDRGALSAAERTRHFDVLGPTLRDKRREVHELPDGYEFRFASDPQTYRELTEWIDGERRCCPFMDLGLRVVPEGGPLWLRVTGRPGTKQFIEADGASWIKPVI